MRLPPYGSTIDRSQDTIHIFVGFHNQVFPHVRHRYRNTCGLFLFDDSQNYRWPVQSREIILFYWLAPNDEWIERTVLSLLRNGAKYIYAYCIPNHYKTEYKGS